MSNNIRMFEERPEGSETMSPEMMNANRYYQWTASQFLPHLQDNILDIGGGYGAHLPYILEQFPHVKSIELSDYNVEFMRKRFADYPHFVAEQVDFGADDVARLATEGYTSITCFNVLEHIEDDIKALQDMHTILAEQNGTLCIQVPALRWLYGSMDSQAGHYRRYTLDEVKEKLVKAGFSIVEAYYFNILGVLPWFVSARVLKRPLQADSVNFQIKVFNALVPLLKPVEAIVPLPLGQSVIAIAKVQA